MCPGVQGCSRDFLSLHFTKCRVLLISNGAEGCTTYSCAPDRKGWMEMVSGQQLLIMPYLGIWNCIAWHPQAGWIDMPIHLQPGLWQARLPLLKGIRQMRTAGCFFPFLEFLSLSCSSSPPPFPLLSSLPPKLFPHKIEKLLEIRIIQPPTPNTILSTPPFPK